MEYDGVDAQKLYNDAIIKSDINLMIIALKHGAQINNSDNKKNTINFAIKVMLNNKKISEFNLGFIRKLTKIGAIPPTSYSSNDQGLHVLTCIIKYAKQYIDYGSLSGHNNEAEKNILDLINFMVDEMNCTEIPAQALIKVIEMRNEKILSVLIRQKSRIIENTDDIHILNLAIETQNVNIVRLICNYDNDKCEVIRPMNESFPVFNTLTQAMLTNQPEIVKEVILKGARPYNKYEWDGFCKYTTFWCYYNYIDSLPISEQTTSIVDRMLGLLMCSGASIPDYLCEKIMKKKEEKRETSFDNKIIDCYGLLLSKDCEKSKSLEFGKLCDQREETNEMYHIIMKNFNNVQNIRYYESNCKQERLLRYEKLKKHLIDQMGDLMQDNTHKKSTINAMEQIMHCVPSVCIEIIYEYLHVESKVQFIDWSKY